MDQVMQYRALMQVSQRSGVPFGICLSLLDDGWVYVERMGQEPTWEAPA